MSNTTNKELEIWKQYEHDLRFEFSNMGNIRKNGVLVEAKISKKTGRREVSIYHRGQYKRCRVYRLVAELFIPNPLGLATINHMNGIKTDDMVSNLEWMTASDNVKHGWKHNLMTIGYRHKGSEHYFSKSVIKLDLKGNFIKRYDSMTDAADDGYRKSSISKCIKGEYKSSFGFKWADAELYDKENSIPESEISELHKLAHAECRSTSHSPFTAYLAGYNAALQLSAHCKEKEEWVPIYGGHLPGIGEVVLVYTERDFENDPNVVKAYIYDSGGFKYWQSAELHEDEDIEPTHWQPLPSPPNTN